MLLKKKECVSAQQGNTWKLMIGIPLKMQGVKLVLQILIQLREPRL
jgi:hypothetical protein